MAKEFLRCAFWKWLGGCGGLFLVGFFWLCCPYRAWAEAPCGLSTSVWAGYYIPQDTNFRRVYNKDNIYSDEGQLALFLEFSKSWFSQIELAAGFGGTQFRGYTLLGPDNPSIDRVKMSLLAGYTQVSYLFRYVEGQMLVPYFGGGFDAWGYQEKEEGDDPVRGGKYGYHGLVGVRLLLDWLDHRAAESSRQEFGIENTYLVFEAKWLKINNFGESKLDFSGRLYRAGLLWEF
ncbi:MAG: hypothetical protein K6U11_12530 [bacterium]|nr:hypothetical protein [bacterium]